VYEFSQLNDDARAVEGWCTSGEALWQTCVHAYDNIYHSVACFDLAVPGNGLQFVGFRLLPSFLLGLVPDVPRFCQALRPVRCIPTVRYFLTDYQVVRVGPSFAVLLGRSAQPYHTFPPAPVGHFSLGVSWYLL